MIEHYLSMSLTYFSNASFVIGSIHMQTLQKIQQFLPLNSFLLLMDQYIKTIKILENLSELESKDHATRLRRYLKQRLLPLDPNSIKIYENLSGLEMIYSLSNLY